MAVGDFPFPAFADLEATLWIVGDGYSYVRTLWYDVFTHFSQSTSTDATIRGTGLRNRTVPIDHTDLLLLTPSSFTWRRNLPIVFHVRRTQEIVQGNAGHFRIIRGKIRTDRNWVVIFGHLIPIHAVGEEVQTVFFANLVAVRSSRARFNLQDAGDCLPNVSWTGRCIPQRYSEKRKDQFVLFLPEEEVVLCCVVCLGRTRSEQFRGPPVEVGAEAQAVAAQLAGFIN